MQLFDRNKAIIMFIEGVRATSQPAKSTSKFNQ